MTRNDTPEKSYGVLQQHQAGSLVDGAAEQVRNLGFAILDSGYSSSELKDISDEFNRTRSQYIEAHGEAELRNANELHTIRALLTHGGRAFLDLALNDNLQSALKRLISGKFILNQQNGVINPARETYNQGTWHRDLPYQHFVSSRPLAINALFCVDDFTRENGATFILPASHLAEEFPSPSYVQKNAIQVEAKAGSFILLDCMVFHAGGFNGTEKPRRAVNHVFNIPYFKQQINIPKNMKNTELSDEVKELLGFGHLEPESIADYLSSRVGKKY
ncbi:MAG TPA: phytanoyl-CoA dioxygenase family protein [Gammaproteobacteria bacterium]|jgi:ectoine hydroxylase-related dioxygenase (phytanoyl-CoA dioxygenase family)|nr:phytanoyl-CoA dioxygenase family protein [Gammaproteobacteria bacterium]